LPRIHADQLREAFERAPVEHRLAVLEEAVIAAFDDRSKQSASAAVKAVAKVAAQLKGTKAGA
jgi:hypothetical protein